MKKINLLSLLVIMMAFVSSCSSDDEPKNLAAETTGRYTGYTLASCQYFSNMAASDQVVTITSSEVNKVNISYTSDTWGTMTIDGADLSGGAGSILIKGAGKSSMAHAGSAAKEYDCTVEGSLVGNDLSLTFSCPQVMGGLKIEFKQGDIPAEIVVPGTYSGYTEAKSTYFQGMMADDQQIVITKNTDDTYKVEYSSDTWGDFSVSAATVQYADGKFTVSGKGTTEMGMNGNVKEYECSFEGTIDVAKENPTFTFSVPAVMGGLSIEFHTGKMPATE
ncbi:MAG: calycin-like domain-containing protein [Muribaculaceae bacterium]